MNTIHQWASAYVAAGISVIPVAYKNKRPDFRLLPLGNDGDPTWEPYKLRIPSQSELDQWFDSDYHNYGVIVSTNNLLILDFDDVTQYTEWLLWAARVGGDTQRIANTAFRVASARGVHVYLRSLNTERNRKVGKIDIKGSGYVLGPGSIHPSGATYQPLRDTFVFPLIRQLSDVLPADLLVHNTEVKSQVSIKINSACVDPWHVVNNGNGNGNSKDIVKKIKSAYQVEDFLNLEVKSSSDSRWWLCRCPLHHDDNPSMWVDTRDQMCGCFAGCTDMPLDVINLYARINGIDNKSAIRILGESLE